jgi:hypothetical protein
MLALLLALMLSAGARGGERFFDGVEDLPVMPGLAEIAAEGMTFESGDGRIVERAASGRVDRDQVLRFYAAALPQLGWRPRGRATYLREGERLRIEFYGGGRQPEREILVRFLISPG